MIINLGSISNIIGGLFIHLFIYIQSFNDHNVIMNEILIQVSKNEEESGYNLYLIC